MSVWDAHVEGGAAFLRQRARSSAFRRRDERSLSQRRTDVRNDHQVLCFLGDRAGKWQGKKREQPPGERRRRVAHIYRCRPVRSKRPAPGPASVGLACKGKGPPAAEAADSVISRVLPQTHGHTRKRAQKRPGRNSETAPRPWMAPSVAQFRLGNRLCARLDRLSPSFLPCGSLIVLRARPA